MAPLPWLAPDTGGSFLEIEGRPTGEDADADGEVNIDWRRGWGLQGNAQSDAEPRTGA